MIELNTFQMGEKAISLLQATFDLLKNEVGAKIANDSLDFESVEKYLSQLNLFDNQKIALANAFEIGSSSNPQYVLNAYGPTAPEKINSYGFLGYTGAYSKLAKDNVVRYSETSYFGMATTSKDFGHVFIRPESFWDKVAEVLHKTEVKFDTHPGFSDKYYTLADNAEKALDTMNHDLLETIYKLDGAFIEFANDKVVIGFNRLITKEDVLNICKFCDYVVQNC